MRIAVNLLGAFEVRVGSHMIEAAQWKLRHPRQLLQMVLMEPADALRREQALSGLWPHLADEAAVNRLHHTLHLLRGLFARSGVPKDSPVIALEGGVLALGAAHEFEIDVRAFRECITRARTQRETSARVSALAAALSLYRGELLDGSPHEDWLASQRESLRLEHLWALQELAVLRRADGHDDAAIALYQKIVDAEPVNELAHRALMELFERTHHPERAIHQYAVCKRGLQREIDAEPSPMTDALLQGIVSRMTERAAREAPAQPVGSKAPTHALPLIGRSVEVQTLAACLRDSGTRLVTVCGGSGMGKTRLAEAVAEVCQPHFEDGVITLELSAVHNEAQVRAKLAAVLGLEQADAQHLAQALAQRQLLLLLDRCEHLADVAALASQWIAAAPRLRVLATSQVALRVSAERVFELPGLVGAVADDAIELFRRSAAQHGAEFAGEQVMFDIDSICRRLEGNPLAIQLAAGQTSRLTLTEIANDVGRPLDWKADAGQVAPAQQRSLRAALSWSVGLLAADLQRLFAMLGVFAGRFTLRDAQAVLAPLCSAEAVHRGTQELLGRHLLARCRSEESGRSQMRLVLLDAPRQLAREMCVGAPWHSQLMQAHAAHIAACCAHLYERKAQPVEGHLPMAESMEAVLSDVRMIFSAEHRLCDVALRHQIAFHAGSLLMFTCAAAEAQAWLRAAATLALPTDASADELAMCAKVHFTLGAAHRILGEFEQASACMRRARSIARRAQPNSALARVITSRLAAFRAQQGRVFLARRMLQALVRDSAAATPKNLAEDLQALATLHLLLGEFGAAHEHVQRAYDLALKAGDAYGTLLTAYTLGQVQLYMGLTERARETHDECLVMLEQGFPFNSSVAVRLADVVIDIEACQFDRAAQKLPAVQALVEPMRGKRLWRAVSAVADWLRVERGRWDELNFLDSPEADAFEFEADFGELFVTVQCLRMRVFARQARWDKVCECLDKLRQCRTLRAGALWQGCVLCACCDVALERDRVEAAAELLVQARRCLAPPTAQPSPRVQRHLATLRSRLPRRMSDAVARSRRPAPPVAWEPAFEALVSGVLAAGPAPALAATA
jgi:DNA-binding SARP family transcriptional activator